MSAVARSHRTSLPFFRNCLRERNEILLSDAWESLDRVQVLGDEDRRIGHFGCVNALSWSSDGNILISSGDDTRICLWKLSSNEYTCDTVIDTGHTDNVFSAHFLPSSTRIATCAGDRQVRIFDVKRAGHHRTEDACTQVLECHRRRVKKVVPQDGPDYFLTVSEDQTVRGHDLRTPHSCPACPPPLVKMPHPLSALALSPLSPWLFAVAGESPHAHLFDRRMIHRVMLREWGVPAKDDEIVTCVRSFGRASRPSGENEGDEHISGARMSPTNGHELILSYMTDGIYLFSIYDDPTDSTAAERGGTILPSSSEFPTSRRSKRRSPTGPHAELAYVEEAGDEHGIRGEDGECEHEIDSQGVIDILMSDDEYDDDIEADDDGETPGSDESGSETIPIRGPSITQPLVHPRRRYAGACNVETIKDVNFLGFSDEYIASGSDEGNWFLWMKETAEIVGIWEGDGSVVNCIEGHPTLPLVAVSGIDSSVKLFAPGCPEVSTRRIQDKQKIIQDNSDPQRRLANLRRMHLQDILLSLQLPENQRDGSLCVIM